MISSLNMSTREGKASRANSRERLASFEIDSKGKVKGMAKGKSKVNEYRWQRLSLAGTRLLGRAQRLLLLDSQPSDDRPPLEGDLMGDISASKDWEMT